MDEAVIWPTAVAPTDRHAIFDVDNDGDVDFWSGNHDSYYVETCFRNDGSANFSDIGSLGFSDPNNNEGVAAADVNRDGWCDIVHFCENDNWIGHHQGDPGASLPSLVGTKDSSYGLSDSGDHGNGDFVSAGDVNNDGYLDFFYHYSGGKLFVSDGDGTYTENVRGINVTTGNSDKFGSAWADYDNDGDLDLYCARWDANQKGYLWRNNVTWAPSVSGTFSNQSDDAAINDESGQFGCAWGDYDNDGDLDLYVATRSGPNKLYQNQGNGTFRMSLLLSRDAMIDTKPQLEILADDVKCTHGATVGQLDDEAIFYLRSRGVSVDAARSLLIYAFAGESIGQVRIAALRDKLQDLLSERLHYGESLTFGRPFEYSDDFADLVRAADRRRET